MECPHCSKELEAAQCPGCGQTALPGSGYCHHCGHELPAAPGEGAPLLTCSNCDQKALPGGDFCHHCGHELPAGPGEEAPQLPTCDDCGHTGRAGERFCAMCGRGMGGDGEDEAEGEAVGFDPSERVACSDGNCIGIIGPDGKCTECGQAYSGPDPELG